MKENGMLEFNEWSGLQTGRIATIHNEMATLHFAGKMFIMAGPSGSHALHGDTTDMERLNAHWTGFCADVRNKFSTPMVKA